MRIIPQDKKKIVSVLGLPNSGTTIVCNILNSMDNAFCISEPHWATLSRPQHVRFDKVGSFKISGVAGIMNEVQKKLKENKQYNFGGVKETFRPFDERVNKCLNKIIDESDIVVYVLRDPKAHYNSLKKTTVGTSRNPVPIERIVNDIKKFEKSIKRTKNKVILTVEGVCKAGNAGVIQYINQKAGGLLKVEGPFRLKKTDYIYGNNVANRSNKIIPANMSTQFLTGQDIRAVESGIVPTYNRILKMGN